MVKSMPIKSAYPLSFSGIISLLSNPGIVTIPSFERCRIGDGWQRG
jgi:hypothetical protein